ncbi:MAG: CHAT domain-containing protein, partial [Pseudorhodobacter sp.]|nr:CHAT domain-containing protein [Pseudorhodobacter sp.]
MRFLPTLVSLILLCALAPALPAKAQPRDFSESAKTRVGQARGVAAEGRLEDALALLAAAQECAAGQTLSEQQAVDCGILDWTAGELAQDLPDPTQSASHYHRAARRLARVAATQSLAELAGVKAADRYQRAKQPTLAAERLAEARALRQSAALPVTLAATASAAVGARLAVASGDPLRINAESEFALGLMRDAPNDPAILRDANRVLARLLTGMGLYVTAETALSLAMAGAEQAVQAVAYTDPALLAPACEALVQTNLESADLKAGAEALPEAYNDASRADGFADISHPCAGQIPDRLAIKADLMRAAIHLGGGQALSAQLQLAGVAALPGLSPADHQAAKAAQINARLSLGFVEEAAAYYADHPAAEDLLEDYGTERERRMAHARLALLQGDPQAALESLRLAQDLQARHAPLDWFARARLAYRQALILSELGEFEQAKALEADFDAEFGAFIAETTLMMAAADAANAQAMIDQSKGESWHDFIASGLADRAEARFRHVSVRGLQKMRMLLSLSLAVHQGDKAEATRLFGLLPEVGLPSQIGMVPHSQRAYTLGCLMARGPGMECDLLIQWAADYPQAPPLYCVPDCGFVPDPGALLPLTADLIRKGPLRAPFLAPVLEALAASARQAAEEAALAAPPLPDGMGNGLSDSLSDFMQGNAGAHLAFTLAQQFSEGAAATATVQLGQRLMAKAPEAAHLLRERGRLSDLIADGLRKGATSSPDFTRALAELQALSPQIAALPKDYGPFFGNQTLSRFDIPSYLPEGEAFVLIVSAKTASYVFAIRGESFAWHQVPIPAEALRATVAKLRQSLDPTGQSRAAAPLNDPASQIAPFDRSATHALYQAFLAPLAPLLGDQTLHLVVDGPLASLPLSLLVASPPEGRDDDPEALRSTDWLIRHNPMVFYTSPAALIVSALQRDLPQGDLPFIGFGDPLFTPPDGASAPFAGLAPLPGTRAEVQALASLLGAQEGTVYLREAATKSALLAADQSRDLARARVLAFATHGLLAGQMGVTEPGLVLTMPGLNPRPKASFLSASDAAALDLNADWVLLSACNTAAADGQPDSSGLSGLARGFIFAGARSLLVSHWPVRDDAALALTTRALGARTGPQPLSKAKALQAAILALLQDETRPDHAHPAVWAPFVLIGNG